MSLIFVLSHITCFAFNLLYFLFLFIFFHPVCRNHSKSLVFRHCTKKRSSTNSKLERNLLCMLPRRLQSKDFTNFRHLLRNQNVSPRKNARNARSQQQPHSVRARIMKSHRASIVRKSDRKTKASKRHPTPNTTIHPRRRKRRKRTRRAPRTARRRSTSRGRRRVRGPQNSARKSPKKKSSLRSKWRSALTTKRSSIRHRAKTWTTLSRTTFPMRCC